MERLIVNEGQGPVSRDLTAARTRVGGEAGCDVVLRDPSAAGRTFAIERTSNGHRARRLQGDVFHNERLLDLADLVHNDTLRAGDSLVLYKNPVATLPPPGESSTPWRSEVPPPTFEELALIEDLEPLEELEPADEHVRAEVRAEVRATADVARPEPAQLPAAPGLQASRAHRLFSAVALSPGRAGARPVPPRHSGRPSR